MTTTADRAAPVDLSLVELVTGVPPGAAPVVERPDELRQRLLVCTALAAPVVAMSLVPALQFTHWQWIALALAAPVVAWGALPFHRSTATDLRHGVATADTLVSISTVAALGWSLYALLFGGAGTPGTVQPFDLTPARIDALYLGVAAAVTALALAGRYAEVRAALHRPADRAAGVFVPIVLALALGTLGFWLGTGGGTAPACAAAVAVLIIACPCASGLAAPMALLAATARGARLGILLTGRAAAAGRRVDTVALAGTGTLTTGRMSLHAVHPVEGIDPDEALRMAGAVEDGSRQPIGAAIAAAARERLGELPGVSEFDSLPGLGVRGLVSELVDGDIVRAHAVLVGRPALLDEHGVDLPVELATALADAEADGATAVAVAWDGAARAVLTLGGTVRPGSTAAVARLRALGLRPLVVAGNSVAAATRPARAVGITEVVPGGEIACVRALQAEGRIVAVVGDGRHDAAALATADLGIAIGPDAAILAAVDAIRLSRRTHTVIRVGLFWAFAGTVAALPIAAAGLLNPVIAALVTALPAVLVVAGGLLLRPFAPLHRPRT